MARNIFGVVANSRSLPNESILQVAARLNNFFTNMSKIDPILSKPYFVGKTDSDLHPLDINQPDFVQRLAELILKYAKGDISTYEKVNKPTIDFSREFGFINLFTIKDDQSTDIFNVMSNLGGNSGGGISLNGFNRRSEKGFDFSWYYSMLKGLVGQLDADEGLVSISIGSFNSDTASLRIKQPFGWITYVAGTHPVKIPRDLPGIEYERSENGTYMIATREDFSNNKELFNTQTQKLLNVMAEIKRRIPEYSKD